jgi:hypothetical protein
MVFSGPQTDGRHHICTLHPLSASIGSDERGIGDRFRLSLASNARHRLGWNEKMPPIQKPCCENGNSYPSAVSRLGRMLASSASASASGGPLFVSPALVDGVPGRRADVGSALVSATHSFRDGSPTESVDRFRSESGACAGGPECRLGMAPGSTAPGVGGETRQPHAVRGRQGAVFPCGRSAASPWASRPGRHQ